MVALSHCSPLSTTPSPHFGNLQLVLQESPKISEFSSPWSHCSPASRTPFPQSFLQPPNPVAFGLVHPDVGFGPRSHCSPESKMKSPQKGTLQFGLQLLGLFELLSEPESHSSPLSISTIPSPHFGPRQLTLQASDLLLELNGPSSHSSQTSVTPSPQISWQVLLH